MFSELWEHPAWRTADFRCPPGHEPAPARRPQVRRPDTELLRDEHGSVGRLALRSRVGCPRPDPDAGLGHETCRSSWGKGEQRLEAPPAPLGSGAGRAHSPRPLPSAARLLPPEPRCLLWLRAAAIPAAPACVTARNLLSPLTPFGEAWDGSGQASSAPSPGLGVGLSPWLRTTGGLAVAGGAPGL